MSRAETGGVWVSLFPPSGVPWHLLFLYFFFFCEPGSHFFSEVDLRLKLDFSKASILPSWGLSSLSVKR